MDPWATFVEPLIPEGGWSVQFVVRTVYSTALVFAYVILIARAFGARTFASFTSFDFLINIAAGSIVASSILGENIAGGALALGTLAVLQWIISKVNAVSSAGHRILDNPPTVLMERGRFLRDEMRRVRVSEQSIMQKLRNQGVTDMGKVRLAVLESGGNISIVSGGPDEEVATYPKRDSGG